MSYTYNLDGLMATMTYPSATAGRTLSAIDQDNNINYVTGAKYNATGAFTGSVYGQVNSFRFNNRLQPNVQRRT